MLVAAFAQYFFGISIFVSSIFLVLLVLVQRGRGGGLTGALGGAGGQSAFGTKAGDLFTRITIGVATVWIFLCAASVYFLKSRGLPQLSGSGTTVNFEAPDSMGSGAAPTDEGALGIGTGSAPAVDPESDLAPLDGSDSTTDGGVEAELTEFDTLESAATDSAPATEDEGGNSNPTSGAESESKSGEGS